MCISYLFCIVLINAAEVLEGNGNKNQSFKVPVREHAFYIPQGRFFVGADQEAKDNNYALAGVFRTQNIFKPLAPKKVTLNNKDKQENPYHGAAISKLALLERRPVVVKQGVPSSLAIIEDLKEGDPKNEEVVIVQADDIHDAQGNTARSLLALTTNAPEVTKPLEATSERAAFVILGNDESNLNGNGAGIGLMFLRRLKPKKGSDFVTWDIVNAQTGEKQFTDQGEPTGKGNLAVPLSTDTPAIFIGEPVAHVGTQVVDAFYDRDLARLYVSYDVQANDGARAVLLAQVVNGKIVMQPIAMDQAFDENDHIVGIRQPSTIQIAKIRTMQTRTHLRYLIVQRGNDTVYALPLVDNLKSQYHGTLADITSEPVTLFKKNPPHRFEARVFTTNAKQPSELATLTTPLAQVGGGEALPGTITDLSVSTEAVYVSIEATDAGTIAPGIFYSQPLFDTLGRITAWTPWQRTVANPTQGFGYDPFTLQFSFISSGKTVFRNKWSDGKDPLGSFVTSVLRCGVLGLVDFPFTTPSFSQVPGERLSVQVYTGNNKVLLLQTGGDTDMRFGPQLTTTSPYISTDGTLQGFTPTGALILSGGSLQGDLNSAAIVAHRFIVGGSEGVFMLADEAGNGWDTLSSGFEGLSQTFSWQRISSTTNVRKLLASGNNLFILSEKKLERISFPGIETTELTQAEESFSDVTINGPLAIVATSLGLKQSPEQVDVQTSGPFDLVQIPLPEAAGGENGPAIRLIDLDTNIYVLNGFVSQVQALIYRFVITGTTVELFPDFFVKDRKTFFASLGDYRNYIATDGSIITMSRSSYAGREPFIEGLPPFIRSGDLSRDKRPLILSECDSNTMGLLQRSSASGQWQVTGNFGVRTLL